LYGKVVTTIKCYEDKISHFVGRVDRKICNINV